MVKKVSIIVLILAVILLFKGTDIYYYFVDDNHWKQMKTGITEQNVSKIILETGNPIELADKEKSNFITSLNKAEFYKSNWRKEGPTGAIIFITFKDGSKQSLEYWGNGKFETTYENGQFIITSVDIENIMRKYNISLN